MAVNVVLPLRGAGKVTWGIAAMSITQSGAPEDIQKHSAFRLLDTNVGIYIIVSVINDNVHWEGWIHN